MNSLKTHVLGRLGVLLAVLLAGGCASPPNRAPDPWRAEIDALTANDRDAPPAPGGVVLVGSSSIRMWTTLADDFPGLVMINRGFGGSELADSVRHFGRIVAPYRPRVVVLYAGDNDINAGKSAEEVLADFGAFRKRMAKDLPAARLVFLSIKESPARAHRRHEMRRANELIAAACAKDSRCRFADVAATLIAEDGSFRTELFESDGLHINRAGYEAWARVLAAELASVFAGFPGPATGLRDL